MSHLKNLTLKVWRQSGPQDAGRFETHEVAEISDEASFLELLDVLNEQLINENKEAVVFDIRNGSERHSFLHVRERLDTSPFPTGRSHQHGQPSRVSD